jgi:hypothetical protein
MIVGDDHVARLAFGNDGCPLSNQNHLERVVKSASHGGLVSVEYNKIKKTKKKQFTKKLMENFTFIRHLSEAGADRPANNRPIRSMWSVGLRGCNVHE